MVLRKCFALPDTGKTAAPGCGILFPCVDNRWEEDGKGAAFPKRITSQAHVGTVARKMSQLRSMDDIVTRLRENWVGYAHEYRIFLILVVLASLADMASTIHFMMATGPEGEWHPTVRFAAQFFGPVLGPVFGKAVQVIVVITLTVFLRRWAVFIFIPVIIMYTWAAWYNIWGYHLYYPRLLHILEYLAI